MTLQARNSTHGQSDDCVKHPARQNLRVLQRIMGMFDDPSDKQSIKSFEVHWISVDLRPRGRLGEDGGIVLCRGHCDHG